MSQVDSLSYFLEVAYGMDDLRYTAKAVKADNSSGPLERYRYTFHPFTHEKRIELRSTNNLERKFISHLPA